MFLAWVVPLPGAQSADRPSSEDGTIVIHHIARPIGQERYRLNRTDDGIALTAKLDFNDRGGRVELSSAMRLASDLSPISFDATGRTIPMWKFATEPSISVTWAPSRTEKSRSTFSQAAATPRSLHEPC
jgi:hypothetical protein